MLPITIVISIPSDLKKTFDQAISNANNLLSSLINDPSDSILSTIKKAIANKHSKRQELISCICEIYSIQANFPTYTTKKLNSIIEQAAKIKGILKDPILVNHKNYAYKSISQKKSTEAVWIQDLQDYYSSINAYIQSINISMSLISKTENQISDNLKYIESLFDKIDKIHANPDAEIIQAYNKIHSDINNIQAEFLKIQKTLPQYSKALNSEITMSNQNISQLNNFIAHLSTNTTLSQAIKIIKTFKLSANNYNKISKIENNPLLSDISQKSDTCSSLEEQLKGSNSSITKQITDFNKNYTQNLAKSNAAQDDALSDLEKNIPEAVSTLDKTITSAIPLIKQSEGTKNEFASVKDNIDQIHKHPKTGIFSNTKNEERTDYDILNSLLKSYISKLDKNVNECKDICGQARKLKDNFSSYLGKIRDLKTAQKTIKDLQQQITTINKNMSDDTKKATVLFNKFSRISSNLKKIRDDFSNDKRISTYINNYKK